MKKLLTTAIVLGTVLAIDATQPTEAAVTQPIASSQDQSQSTPAAWIDRFGNVHRPWLWRHDPAYRAIHPFGGQWAPWKAWRY